MGNCADDEQFFEHYGFLCGELLRVTRPGRICAVHVKDMLNRKGATGNTGLRDFSGDVIRAHESAGWVFHSRITIWKDPVMEMQRTKSLGLLHKQVCKDSTLSRQGLPDYVVVFRKWGGDEGEVHPVMGSNGAYRFAGYVGEDEPASSGPRDKSISVWEKYASPVWFDIDQGRVLSVQDARSDRDERHICPLQLDVIERCVHLWSNPGDVIFSPFAGIGSELYGALNLGRRACGIELKPEYWRVAVSNCNKALESRSQMELFK
jgi:hypothetical protein